jgi:hypothetical protein
VSTTPSTADDAIESRRCRTRASVPIKGQ